MSQSLDQPKSLTLDAPARIEYPAALVYALVGLLGCAANFVTTLALSGLLSSLELAFCAGIAVNVLLQTAFYQVIYYPRRYRRPVQSPSLFATILVFMLAGLGTLSTIREYLHLGDGLAVLASIGVLSLLSALTVRLQTFASSELAQVAYKKVAGDFYEAQTDEGEVGWFRSWYHSARFDRLRELIESHYRDGMSIADFGCGNCMWNTGRLPVVGVDINRAMLVHAAGQGRLESFSVSEDLSRSGIEGPFDMVVISEVLEHVAEVGEVLAEIRRVLKPGGTLIATVPWDFFLSPFSILFNANCLWQGFVKGSEYHRLRCGHIHHFSRRRFARLLASHGFAVRRTTIVNGLLVYAVAGSARSPRDSS